MSGIKKTHVVVMVGNNARILTNPKLEDIPEGVMAIVNPDIPAGFPPHFWKLSEQGRIEPMTSQQELQERETEIEQKGADVKLRRQLKPRDPEKYTAPDYVPPPEKLEEEAAVKALESQEAGKPESDTSAWLKVAAAGAAVAAAGAGYYFLT